MTPTNFPQANRVLSPPADLDERQCGSIPAYVGEVQPGSSLDGASIVVVAWRPNAAELAVLNAGGNVFLSCIGGLVPHLLSVDFDAAISPR